MRQPASASIVVLTVVSAMLEKTDAFVWPCRSRNRLAICVRSWALCLCVPRQVTVCTASACSAHSSRRNALQLWAVGLTGARSACFVQRTPMCVLRESVFYAYEWGCWVRCRPDGSAMQISEAPQCRCMLLLKNNQSELLQPGPRAVCPSLGRLTHFQCMLACTRHFVLCITQGNHRR